MINSVSWRGNFHSVGSQYPVEVDPKIIDKNMEVKSVIALLNSEL